MAEDQGSKTENATPRKREKSREEGQVANSKELTSFAVLFAAAIVFYFGADWMVGSLREMMRGLFLMIGGVALNVDSLYTLFAHLGLKVVILLAPLLLAVMVAGVAANVAQVGFRITPKTLAPDLKKVDPINGFKRIVSLRSLVELIKSVAKIILISWIAYGVMRDSFPEMVSLSLLTLPEIIAFVGVVSFKILLRVLGALLILAVLDFAYQRYDHDKRIRMSKNEVKDELKNFEGDPKIKARQRSIQREMAMRRMMAEVPKADVIITNPTHVAVAIKYDVLRADAPTVVAKGQNLVAEKIKEKAMEAGVPIVERPPLARQLFKSVKIGQMIPRDLFEAVAQVLAYIYNLKNSKVG